MTADWYLIYTKVKGEELALDHLRRQRFDVYMPKIKVLVKGRTGYHEQVVPMFYRYLFVRMNEYANDWYPIKNTRGVSKLVIFGDRPALIPDALLNCIREREYRESDEAPEHPIQVGDTVRIFQGVFAGHEGVVEAATSGDRVALLLSYAEQYTRLTLSRDHVERSG